jgi:hypothetical protein
MARQFVAGTGDMIESVNPFNPDDTSFSASVWAYADGYIGAIANNLNIILQQYDDGGTGRGWLYLIWDGGAANLLLTSFVGGLLTQGTTDFQGITNQWMHFACSHSGGGGVGTYRIYYNGFQEDGTGGNTAESSDGDMIWGHPKIAETPTVEGWDGRLCEGGIWDVKLSNDEIKMLAAGVPPIHVRTESLQTYLPMYGTDSPEPDHSGNGLSGTVTGATQADHGPTMAPYGFTLYEPLAAPTPPTTTDWSLQRQWSATGLRRR